MKYRWPAGGGWTFTFCCEVLFTTGHLISLRVSGLVSGDLLQVMDASAHHAAQSLGPLAGRAPENRKGGERSAPASLPLRPGGQPLTSVGNVPRNPLLPLLKTRSAKQGTQTSHSHLEGGTKTGSKEMAPGAARPARPARGRRSHGAERDGPGHQSSTRPKVTAENRRATGTKQ